MYNLKNNFEGSLILSTVLHIVIIGFFMFGAPSFFRPMPKEQSVMTFEVVPISEIDNIQTTQKAEELEEEEEEEEFKEVKTTAEPKPKEEAKTEDEEKPEVKENDEPKEIIPEKENKKKQEKKPEPKTPPVEEVDPIDSILKNIEKESKGTNKEAHKKTRKSKKPNRRRAMGGEYDKNSPLSITEKTLIRGQIQRHWRKPVGVKNLSQIRVYLSMEVAKDGRIKDVWVTDTKCPPNSGSACKIAERSILRAAKKASPLQNLPPARYDTWKELTIELAPSQF